MVNALKQTPWPVALLILSFLCPTELSVYIGGARLPPHRVLLLLLLPIALISMLGRNGIRPKIFDAIFLGFSVWTLFVYVHHHGTADGLQSGGALALDSFGSFLVARAFVRDERAFAGTAAALLLAVGVTGLIAFPEAISGKFFVHDFLGQVTGYIHPTGVEKRAGLTRAFATFDHPIHLGTFCASSLALAMYAANKQIGAAARFVVIAASAMMSLSSAPLLSLVAQLAFTGYERITRGIKGRIAICVAVIVLAFVVVSLVATRSPFALIATGLTFDSWTGYYRLMIWENGLLNVWANPWVGIGLNDWERPKWMVSPSIDAFWLVIAIRGGLPAFLLLALGIAILTRGIAVRMRQADPVTVRIATGWILSLLALSLVGCTVHYWNVPFAYFFFFLGLGGCLVDPLKSVAKARVADQPPVEVTRIRWVEPGMAASQAWSGSAGSAAAPSWVKGAPRWPIPMPTRSEPQARRTTAARSGR